MQHQPYRICVFGRAPKWLAVFLGTLFLIVTILYLITPESPKWLLALLIFTMAPLFILSDRASREWLEISADGRRLTIIPAWYERKFGRKRTSIHEMPEGSSLLICSCTNYGFYGGTSVILRVPTGSETTVYVHLQLPRKIWEEFQKELLVRWNIPVKFVVRTLSADRMEETVWSNEKRPIGWRLLLAGILMLLFPISGALIRLATPNPHTITLVGLVLLSAFALYWRYLFRSLEPDKTSAHLKQNLAVVLFQYAIYYAIAALITDSILRK